MRGGADGGEAYFLLCLFLVAISSVYALLFAPRVPDSIADMQPYSLHSYNVSESLSHSTQPFLPVDQRSCVREGYFDLFLFFSCAVFLCVFVVWVSVLTLKLQNQCGYLALPT